MTLYIFDMGGVLVSDFDVLPEAARRMGIGSEEWGLLTRVDMDALLVGAITEGEYWERMEARSGIRIPENWWQTLFRPKVDPEVDRLIRGLSTKGRVVCGTNVIDSHYDILTARGVYGCFDEVYASHLMGIRKPDPRFWEAILRSEGARASEAFFVDDMEENVAVAERLGIRSHLFKGAAGLVAALGPASAVPAGAPWRR